MCVLGQEEASIFLWLCGPEQSERQCGPKRSYDIWSFLEVSQPLSVSWEKQPQDIPFLLRHRPPFSRFSVHVHEGGRLFTSTFRNLGCITALILPGLLRSRLFALLLLPLIGLSYD